MGAGATDLTVELVTLLKGAAATLLVAPVVVVPTEVLFAIVVVGAAVVAGPGFAVVLLNDDGWRVEVRLAGAWAEFVSEKTSTRRSRGLDHITSWALRRE